MKYGVLIIYYNPSRKVYKKLNIYTSIFKNVLIFDNSENSNLGTIRLSETYNNLTVKVNKENLGISKALEFGFLWAEKHGLDFLLTMDQDSCYSRYNIQTMIKYIDSHYEANVGIYCANYSKLYYDKIRRKYVAEKPKFMKNKVYDVKFCMTSGSFMNMQTVKKVMPLDNYFIALVDIELSTCIRKNGYKLKLVGDSYLAQQVGNDVTRTIYNRMFHILHHTDLRYYYSIRNIFHYIKKYTDDSDARVMGVYTLIRLLLNILLGEKNKLKKFHACYEGYIEYKKGVFGKKTNID